MNTNFEIENDVPEQYNIYFEGGQNSPYDIRFGNRKFSYREESVINKSFKSVIKNTRIEDGQSFTILDYGCGDGRLFKVIENLAKEHYPLKIELVAYDLCKTGLSNFGKTLAGEKYIQETNKLGFFDIYEKDNLKIKLFNLSVKTDVEIFDIKFNLIICMFAVLCHIPGRVNRQGVLKKFAQILDYSGEIILNVSTLRSISKEAITYNTLRTQSKVFSDPSYNIRKVFLRLATEPGDLYFCVKNHNNCADIYGHVYSSQELIEDAKIAGLKPSKGKILSYRQPYDLSRNKILDKIDQFLSFISSLEVLSIKLFERFSKNIYIIAKKQNE